MMHHSNTYSQQTMDYYHHYQTSNNIGYYNTNTFTFEPVNMNTTPIGYSTCSGNSTYFHHHHQQFTPVLCSTSSSTSSSSSSSPPTSYSGSVNGADNSELTAIVSDLAVDEKRPVKELFIGGGGGPITSDLVMTPMIMIAAASELVAASSPLPPPQPPTAKRQRSKQKQEAKIPTAKRVKLEMREHSELKSDNPNVTLLSDRDCDDVYAEHLFRAYQNGEITKSRYKRLIANERERKRMHGLNLAFESLRQVLPSLGSNKQFSKYETLQMAKSYIAALRDILCSDDENPSHIIDQQDEAILSSSSSSSLCSSSSSCDDCAASTSGLLSYQQNRHHFHHHHHHHHQQQQQNSQPI